MAWFNLVTMTCNFALWKDFGLTLQIIQNLPNSQNIYFTWNFNQNLYCYFNHDIKVEASIKMSRFSAKQSNCKWSFLLLYCLIITNKSKILSEPKIIFLS